MSIWVVLVVLAAGSAVGAAGGALGAYISRRLGLLGADIFKPWRREGVPESAGFGLALLLSAGMPLLALLGGDPRVYVAAALLTLYNALVGLVDDVKRMDPVTKPLLTMASASIVMLLCALDPRVYIPLYGWAKLTIIYPLLLPLLIGVFANAFNMVDVVNGSMPTAYISTSIAVLVGYAVMRERLGVEVPEAEHVLLFSMAAVLVYLLLYNRYPAKVFNGDSGSLALGALAAYQAVLAKQELVFLIASSPLILNGFQIVTTVRGFVERRNIPRPTMVDEKGLVHGRCDPRSPPTLVQLLTLRQALSEKEVYLGLLLLYLASLAVSIVAALLVYTRV